MKAIAVYVEGGGPTAAQKAELRQGFNQLLKNEMAASRRKLGSLRFIFCGARSETCKAFLNAVEANSAGINALLVDSESSVIAVPSNTRGDAQIRLDHLRGVDRWQITDVSPERVHLMVQCMETWIVSDPDTLEGFYGRGFSRASLPHRPSLEEEPKADICIKLEKATRNSQKRAYSKIKHASELLALIDPDKVSQRCPRFAIFREWLQERIAD